MRRSSFALALLVLFGCTEKEINLEINVSVPDETVYTASFESPDTKVYVDSDLKAHWTAGDEISIFKSTYNGKYRFSGNTGDIDGSFEKVDVATGSNIPTLYAVYPYNSNTSISTNGVVSLELPSVQHYAENSYGLGDNTMVAVGKTLVSTSFAFKNVCGYVVVNLYGGGTVKSITLTGNNGEKLAGQATVTSAYGQKPVLTMAETATASITLDCGEGVKVGDTAEESTPFWFAVPPQTFTNGFTITVTSPNSLTMEKSTHLERVVVRNQRNMLSSLELKYDMPEGNIKFSCSKFKAYCVDHFDTDGDGEISYKEAAVVTEINCSNKGVTSLNCIKYFYSLKSLRCSSNSISALDVSNNKELEVLICDENKLSSLDVSHNTKLKQLDCYNNNSITALDFSNNNELESLSCGKTQITSLNVGGHTGLKDLSVLWCDKLTSLRISRTSISFFVIPTNLAYLYADNCTSLERVFSTSGNLSTVTVSGCTALESVYCPGSKIKTLDLRTCTSLTSLNCSNCQLGFDLDLSNNTELQSLSCEGNPNLQTIWLIWKHHEFLPTFEYDETVTIKYRDMVNFEDVFFGAYCLEYFDSNDDGGISLDEAAAAKVIKCDGLEISSMEGLQSFTGLDTLDCSNNSIKKLNLTDSRNLRYLKCDNNQLTSLYVSGLDELSYLNCQHNQLPQLDLRNTRAIEYLDCSTNSLKELNTKYLTSLKYLNCGNNTLKSIDISSNLALTELYCYTCDMLSLDITKNTALEVLFCSYNYYSDLVTKNNLALTKLSCDNCGILRLDVTNNTALIELRCRGNKIGNVSCPILDVSTLADLEYLDCAANNLTTLDVSNNLKLKTLYCSQNPRLAEIWLRTGQTLNIYYDRDVSVILYKD